MIGATPGATARTAIPLLFNGKTIGRIDFHVKEILTLKNDCKTRIHTVA